MLLNFSNVLFSVVHEYIKGWWIRSGSYFIIVMHFYDFYLCIFSLKVLLIFFIWFYSFICSICSVKRIFIWCYANKTRQYNYGDLIFLKSFFLSKGKSRFFLPFYSKICVNLFYLKIKSIRTVLCFVFPIQWPGHIKLKIVFLESMYVW